MSPARPSSRRNSSGTFKPYTRGAAQSVNVTPIIIQANSGPGPGSRTGSISSSSPITSPTDPHSPAHLHLPNAHSPPRTPQLKLHQSPQHLNVNTPPHPTPPHIVERPGFPTYAQYKQVETAYLRSLTPRRQGKALISQRMFDRIWDVLHQPDSPGETAQFRFWARKMFTVRTVPGVPRGGAPGGVGAGMNTGPPAAETQEVLLHDNLLVAIQEQLYDLLCYCHGSTGHGGRDKTCALIRKHYTWVPKDLVSSFIKTCPTCIMKKCGGGGVGVGMNLNANAGQQQQRQMEQIQERQEEVQHEHQRLQMHNPPQPHQEAGLPLPGMRDFFQNMYGMDLGVPAPSAHHQAHSHAIPWPTMAGSGSPSEHPLSPMGMGMSLSMSGSGSGSTGISRSGSGSGAGNGSGSTPVSDSSSGSGSGSMHEDDPLALDRDHDSAYPARGEKPHLYGRGGAIGGYPAPHPMVREVALYKGLPNGWQYRHADYASAHAEFMAAKAAEALSGVDQHHNGMQMHLGVDAQSMQRPRVPSILPLWGPDKFTQSEYEAIAAGNAEQLQGLGPVLPGDPHANVNGNGNGDGHESNLSPSTHTPAQFASGAQQMSLQYLLMHTPNDAAVTARPYTPQIDPVLLGYSSADIPATPAGTSPTTAAITGSASTLPSSEHTTNSIDSTSSSPSDSGTHPEPEPAPQSSLVFSQSAKRTPLHIHLDFPPPEKSFQALLAYRDSLGDGNLTPDSPLLGWGPAGAAGAGPSDACASGPTGPDGTTPSGPPSLAYPSSPSPSLSAGSAGSGLSQLSSAFHVNLTDEISTSASADSTPASSALPTPVDEHGHDVNTLGRSAAANLTSVDIKGKRKMDIESEAEAEVRTRLEKELSEGIQIVLGLHAHREMASEA